MDSFSRASKAFSGDAPSPDATQCTNASHVQPNHQSSSVIPSSLAWQYLAQRDMQANERRCLTLHKLLTLPLEELHIFSFTRASTQEFQRKLARKLIKWEEMIEQKAVIARSSSLRGRITPPHRSWEYLHMGIMQG